MTKTLDELHKAWVDASAAYDRAMEECYRPYDRHGAADKAANLELDTAQYAMHIALVNYDAAFQAHIDAMEEAAQLKPCESATNQAQPAPLPR